MPNTDHMNATPWIVLLDGNVAEPDKALLGGKGTSLARMGALGLPVPPAFVITTSACLSYLKQATLPDGLADEINAGIHWLEQQTGRRLGGEKSPLLVSVRSGAAISMPGMMDTVLNLGINDHTEKALAAECGDAQFARDTHRRFYNQFSRVVLKATPPELSADSTPQHWRELINAAAPNPIPETIDKQLLAAVCAVFDSWNTRRAKRYRKHNNIADNLGTAVTIQAMVFGNMDEHSGTGVLFSRNPLTGAREPYGEYLTRAQGEDVVSGEHTPQPLALLHDCQPEAHAQLLKAAVLLEYENRDVQDIEFTLQQGQLYLLQSRNAKRSPQAAVKIALDMQRDGIISKNQALLRVTATQIRALLRPRLADKAIENAELIIQGQSACPGVATGIVVTDSDEAERRAEHGEPVVLARATTSPDDVHGMLAAAAVITEQGGATSHAAVVSRALGRPCIVGCGENSVTRLAGQTITVDGGQGHIYAGKLPVVTPDERDDPLLMQLLSWASASPALKVLRPDEAPDNDILDLNACDGGEDPDRLPELLHGQTAARGGAIASDAGVAAALAAGLEYIIAKPTLAPLLAVLHTQNETQGGLHGK